MMPLVEGVSVDADGAAVSDFRQFFQAEYRRLARALYLLTDDTGEAEDLAQEALVRVYERWDRVRTMESPVGYLYRTAMNLNRSRLRGLIVRAKRMVNLGQEDSVDPPSRWRQETKWTGPSGRCPGANVRRWCSSSGSG
jgi:DNA-directed RNA polymerase specialized sigma24 family protein